MADPELVDERDIVWEHLGHLYRAYIYSPSDVYVAAYDINVSSVEEALVSAKSMTKPHERFSLGVVVDRDGLRGIVWLVGDDPSRLGIRGTE